MNFPIPKIGFNPHPDSDEWTKKSGVFPIKMGRWGFTLVELLVVMAIIGMLVGASVPAISNMARSGDVNRAISGAASALDFAREYAVAQNTYTWVVFAANPASSSGYSLYVTILGSKDGSSNYDDLTPISLDAASIPYDLGKPCNLTVLQKTDTYRGTRVAPLSASPAPGTPKPDAPNTNVNFKFPDSKAESITFLNQHPLEQRVVRFSPSGQVRISGNISQVVELGLQPMKGNSPDANNVAAIQIDGFTGQTRVYRP